MSTEQANQSPANPQPGAYDKLSETIDKKILDFNLKILALLASLLIKPVALATEPFFRKNFGERYFNGTSLLVTIFIWGAIQKVTDMQVGLQGSPLLKGLYEAGFHKSAHWLDAHNFAGKVAWIIAFIYGLIAWRNYFCVKNRRQKGKALHSMSRV